MKPYPPVNPRAARAAAYHRPLLAVFLFCLAVPALAYRAPPPTHDTGTGVIGLEAVQLQPSHWIARQRQPDKVILDRAAIAAQNAAMRQRDPSLRDIEALPARMPGAQIRKEIESLSAPPARALYDESGAAIPADALSRIQANLALDAVPAQQAVRHGLVVHRADLRTFPTSLRAFSTQGETDIDRFQESALFPGDAVAVLHASADGQWWFVASERYTAWIEQRHVALGDKAEVFGYGRKSPYLIVTGATVRTNHTRERPQVSQLQLDMGVRVPLRADWPPAQPVNGQHPHASHVIELPVRDDAGRLAFAPALLPRSADVAPDYLPLTAANLLRQSFKFLGERYGWGHGYDARDCSGFVSEIYRSFGVLLPRNTRDQAVSPALNRIAFSEGDDARRRSAVVRDLQVGDLVYIPGHVMMVIGHEDGMGWVIHDTSGGSWRGADGQRVRAGLNGVSVTPLDPMMFNDTQTYIDRITSIQRIRP
ncbi:SH3 domain-containing protein [Pseudoxanthomonas mexicana]|uniref:SH3 domain-containing protein n=1 Tax=Pseudoxanthomonas mexicana TaxID=128785 RepID=UPI00398AE02E